MEMGLSGGGEWSGPKAQSAVFSRIMRVTGLRSALERAEYLGLPAAESHSGDPKSELRVAMWSFLGVSHPDWDCRVHQWIWQFSHNCEQLTNLSLAHHHSRLLGHQNIF